MTHNQAFNAGEYFEEVSFRPLPEKPEAPRNNRIISFSPIGVPATGLRHSDFGPTRITRSMASIVTTDHDVRSTAHGVLS